MTDRALRHIVVTQLPGIDGDGITTAEKVQLVTDVSAVTATTDVLAALRFDPEHPNYGAVRGTDTVEPIPFVKAQNRAAIQLAADDARDAGGTLVLKGTYWVDATVVFECHVDGSSGSILVSDTSIAPAVQVGPIVSGQVLQSKNIVMPTVRQMGKVGAGWSGNDIGVRYGHVSHCQITATDTRHFSKNIELYANSTGHVHNNYYLGTMFNGKINLDFWAMGPGWINQNVFIGGRFHIASSEGTNISGARHLRTGNASLSYANNNNTFIGPSLEGNGPEYHVEAWGNHNKIEQGRWESSPPKVLWGADANGWVIEDGYQATNITTTGPALNTRIQSRQSLTWFTGNPTSGAIRVGGASSNNNPIYTLYGTGDLWSKNLATDWMWAWGAGRLDAKAEGDAGPRLRITNTGIIAWGDGNGTTDTQLRRLSAGHLQLVAGDVIEAPIMRIGGRYYWTDSTGKLRSQFAKPASSTTTAEGEIVGTQT